MHDYLPMAFYTHISCQSISINCYSNSISSELTGGGVGGGVVV